LYETFDLRADGPRPEIASHNPKKIAGGGMIEVRRSMHEMQSRYAFIANAAAT
jgi:hypothetical protein